MKRSPLSLTRHELNWRQHPPEQMAALRQMLDDVGWIQNVVVNVRTGKLVDGHARLALAIERGEKTIPVVEVDLSEDEERKVLAALDPIGAMATTDAVNLGALLGSLDIGGDALSAMLEKLGQKAGVLEMPEAEVKDVAPRDAQWMVLVECADEKEQTRLLERFAEEGLQVRALIG